MAASVGKVTGRGDLHPVRGKFDLQVRIGRESCRFLADRILARNKRSVGIGERGIIRIMTGEPFPVMLRIIARPLGFLILQLLHDGRRVDLRGSR